MSVVRPGCAAVSLGPANPLMQRLRSATDLARNRDQRCPTRRMFMLVIQNHPHRASSHLRRELVRCLACHGSLSRVGASGKPGAVHGIESPCFVECPIHRAKRAADRADEAQSEGGRDHRLLWRTKSGSPKCRRNRRSAWLTADWVRFEFDRRACQTSARLDHLQNDEQVEVNSGHERRSYPWLNKRHLIPGAHRATLPPSRGETDGF